MNLYTNFNLFNEAIIIINSYDLYSSILDGVHLIRLYNDYFNMNKITIVVDNSNVIDKIKEKCHDSVNFVVHNNLLEIFGEILCNTNYNFILSLSSHGYANGDKNYIFWNRKKTYDYELKNCIDQNMKSNLNCFIIVDTCQSGTMFNLNYQTKDLITFKPENLSQCALNIICVGAVDDTEYNQDDLSDFGYGGGLSSSFIDFISEKIGDNIRDFFIYHKNRVGQIGKHPVLSFNDKNLLSN